MNSKKIGKLVCATAAIIVATSSVSASAAEPDKAVSQQAAQVDVGQALGMPELKPMDTGSMKKADGEWVTVVIAGAAFVVTSYQAALDIARNNADYHTKHGHPTSTHIHWWGYIHNHYQGH